jgi:putative heme-binding domain-containing protein
VWALRLLGESETVSPAVLAAFAERAVSDESALVRLTLASVLQRLPLVDRWPIARGLAAHAEDASDHNLPLMIWYGIEPAVPANPDRAFALAAEAKIRLIRRFIARRLASDLDEHQNAVDSLLTSALNRNDAFVLEVLGGFSEALKGVRQAHPPAQWDAVSRRLDKRDNEDIRTLTRELSLIFGDGRAADALIEIACDETADRQARRTAIANLVEAGVEGFDEMLLQLIPDRIVQEEALAGLAAYDHPRTAATIIRLFPKIRAECQEQAVATLASRPQWALTLLKAAERGEIPRSVISAAGARQMLSLDSDDVSQLLEEVWGVIDRTDAEKKRLIADWTQKLTAESLAGADLTRGRELFNKTCASCHKLYGEGGTIAPDITGSNRHNLLYLLENILEPNRTVPQQWTTSVVLLASGRVVTGVVIRQTDQTWTVQTAKEVLTIPTAEIDESRQTNFSLMPEGQLDALTDADVRDLIAYLQSAQQVPLPE